MGAIETDVKKVSADASGPAEGPPVVLSEGAGRALSTVAARLLKAERRDAHKRPRGTVLAQSEETREAEAAEQAARRRERENKRARLRFEANAKVVPDAATGAALERKLHATATRGAVALFNAVAKAQRVARAEAPKRKKLGKPVSRDSFMDMIRAGVEADAPPSEGAGWLKDDFLMSKSRRLKDWDTADTKEGGAKSGAKDSESEDLSGDSSEEEVEDEVEDEVEEEEEEEESE